MLRQVISHRLEFAEELLRVQVRRVRRAGTAVTDLVFADVPGRFTKTLLQLARRFGFQESGGLRVVHLCRAGSAGWTLGWQIPVGAKNVSHFKRPSGGAPRKREFEEVQVLVC
ncbi:hypothetical protein [Saccharopolyspora shandongensis]|uniref:hypothetical protein n=1 Tax=Saccharopolyspora shandongensis TaxID=418495 RepID=UPI0033D1CC84